MGPTQHPNEGFAKLGYKMMLFAVAVYFALACALAALLLLPSFREKVLVLAVGAWRRMGHASRAMRQVSRSTARGGLAQAEGAAQGMFLWLRTHWIGVSVAAALLVVPPLAVFSLRGWHTLDAFDDSTTASPESVVAALLQGEQLVPPPPLPPEVFTTAEVEKVRPQLSTADRRWEFLDAEFKQRLLLVYKIMREEHGYEMVLLEGYRSPQRQAMLASMGPHVTNAGAWQSYHQHGLAADSAFLRDGRLVISERDPWAMKGYELYGEVSMRLGLTWGGRWKNMDFGHVELRKPGVIRP
jgi:peptidoglycan L-alanyl-D-glutamate endopeptidase CwlK